MTDTQQDTSLTSLPDSLMASTLTDYQKGGVDFRAWMRYELAHLKVELAAPGNRLETEEEQGQQKAIDLMIHRLGDMLLEPLPNPLASAAREIAQAQLESPSGRFRVEARTEPLPEDYPFLGDHSK